jgi:flagellar biosynthetic protein FlhB
MSEESSQDKTEQPTGRRLEQAVEKGQILTSRDLVMAAVLVGSVIQLMFLGRFLFNELTGNFRSGLDFATPMLRDLPLLDVLADRFRGALFLIVLFSLPLALIAIACQFSVGGLHLIISNAAFKPSRLSPLAGLKRMFGSHGLIELGKSILKVAVIGSIGYLLLKSRLPEILGLSLQPFETAMESTGSLLMLILFVLIGAIAVLGILDMFIQWQQHRNRLLMTKQEVKDEYKETEGSPEVKQRIRKLQQEAASRGSVSQVENAQVVIVNPTRFAVALHYDFGEGSAPKVLSKGTEQVALKIRETADQNGIPVLTMPLLARALYYTSEIGSEIHADLYRAVATVLSFVLQAGATGELPEVEIPDQLKFDSNGRQIGGKA